MTCSDDTMVCSPLSFDFVVDFVLALSSLSVALLNDPLLILSAAFWTLSSFSLVVETLLLTSLVVTSGFLNELRNDDTADDDAVTGPKDLVSAG